jgi:hypothetical protein
VTNRSDARPRRRDDGVAPGFLEHLDVMAHQVGGLAPDSRC